MLPADVALAKWLRAAAPPRLVLAANKCERRARDGASGVGDMLTEATRLGLGEPVAISAETGEHVVTACTAPGCTGRKARDGQPDYSTTFAACGSGSKEIHVQWRRWLVVIGAIAAVDQKDLRVPDI